MIFCQIFFFLDPIRYVYWFYLYLRYQFSAGKKLQEKTYLDCTSKQTLRLDRIGWKTPEVQTTLLVEGQLFSGQMVHGKMS